MAFLKTFDETLINLQVLGAVLGGKILIRLSARSLLINPRILDVGDIKNIATVSFGKDMALLVSLGVRSGLPRGGRGFVGTRLTSLKAYLQFRHLIL